MRNAGFEGLPKGRRGEVLLQRIRHGRDPPRQSVCLLSERALNTVDWRELIIPAGRLGAELAN